MADTVLNIMENKKKIYTQTEKVRELAAKAREAVVPLIDRDYVLFGLPYYNNIGDTLIWEGERELLKHVKFKCVGVCGWNTYPAESLERKDVAILITGGGYMGDVWRSAWENVLNCIKLNSGNKIIVLPNTLHYNDRAIADADAKILEGCRDLTLCMRDSRSLQLAREYFPNTKSVLVPDMAFCIAPSYLNRWCNEATKPVMLLKRLDKELASTPIPAEIAALNPDVHDWPTMERLIPGEKWFLRALRRLDMVGRRVPAVKPLRDVMYDRWYRPLMTSTGVRFVSDYKSIYTTRLHVMILSVLLGREVYLIDNSYGKLSTFYDTWLADCKDTYVFQR